MSVFSPNTGKYGPEKTPYLDTFHAVSVKKITGKQFRLTSFRKIVKLKHQLHENSHALIFKNWSIFYIYL